jgi:succinoglycan biosynthesis protein ExoM
MQVSICIATYKRDLLLKRLLVALNLLEFNKIPEPTLEIIVVDNDQMGTAKEVCHEIEKFSKWPIIYDIEPDKGVAHARNRTIARASSTSDFIAIIDDDEEPAPSWLEALLVAQEMYQAGIVQGPVKGLLQEDAPQWVSKGHFFESKQIKTGHLLDAAFTNNVLVRAHLLKSLDPVFDVRFNVKGSEDSYLFMKLRRDGAKIIWCDNAIVYEAIPVSRTNFQWLVKRNFWGYSSFSLFEKELYPSPKIQLFRALKGCALLGLGLARLLPSMLMGKHKRYAACFNMAQGLGTLAGLVGHQGDWQ